MVIHLRQAGQQNPAVIIKNVVYVEPFFGEVGSQGMQFTTKDSTETEFIDVTADGDFAYGEGTYDFLEVFKSDEVTTAREVLAEIIEDQVYDPHSEIFGRIVGAFLALDATL